MAKAVSDKIRLVSGAGTGYFYVTRKNNRPRPGKEQGKLVVRKYDPIARRHVEFKEAKIK